jgi:3-hydroxyacyl-CoA dehydrogenase
MPTKKRGTAWRKGHLDSALKSNPSPIYDKAFASRITVGNFEDDLEKIKNSDWVIEVIVERLDIKQSMFEKVDKLRKRNFGNF